MNIIQILQKRSSFFYASLVLLGLLNAVLGVGVLYLIRSIISKKPLPVFPEFDWLIFLSIIVISFIVSKIFQTYMVKLTNDIFYEFEISMLQRARSATYEAFEKLGLQKVYTAIGDIRILGSVPQLFITGLTSLVSIFCGIGFLFWTSPKGGMIISVLMTLLFAYYSLRNRKIEKDLNKLRDLQNFYYKYLQDLLQGFKEVFMDRKRNENIYHNYLKKNRAEGKDFANTTSIKYVNNALIASNSWYVVIGVILYVLPKFFDLDIYQTTVFLIAVLYLMGPVAAVSSLIPSYTQIKISFERLNHFNAELGGSVQREITSSAADLLSEHFESIRFENVEYEYYDGSVQKSFALKNINIEIERGEVIFITGGNGSGKSTFVNLLTGLYRPTSGSIYLNDKLITTENYAVYSEKMSAIFTNNILLSENYDEFDLTMNNPKLLYYLKMMKLEDSITLNGQVKLNHNLSKGQQKRLALVYALLEEKQIIVLDEWAAEQDPKFRSYFYNVLVPELKNMGKTIIAVTHDDEYYPLADRLIKFDFGSIVAAEQMTAANEEEVSEESKS